MSWTYLGERIIKKSRKEHQCEHCFCLIPLGTSYRIDTGVMDGDLMSTKAHHECSTEYCKYNADSWHDEWYALYEWEGFIEFRKKQEAKYGKFLPEKKVA